jgi:Na+(H+)/acetate symporter ActP
MFATIDPYILAFSSITVIVTIWMGFRSAKTSKTADDFFVAGRSVSVGWNASAISGEYLSAASFMGVAGMVMSSGYDALWYPVCYACGYLFLLLFIAGPLRRFGAYTIPDFAEGRYDSPLFRKIAVVFVLFIGFFYTMPQMKGAGTTLAYIFPGLPYWVGVALVGAVITLNVALGGMKGITLVQAIQYWIKMFAICVPVFVLMAVYGDYGKQLGANGGNIQHSTSNIQSSTNSPAVVDPILDGIKPGWIKISPSKEFESFGSSNLFFKVVSVLGKTEVTFMPAEHLRFKVTQIASNCALFGDYNYFVAAELSPDFIANVDYTTKTPLSGESYVTAMHQMLSGAEVFINRSTNGVARTASLKLSVVPQGKSVYVLPEQRIAQYEQAGLLGHGLGLNRQPLPEKAPVDSAWLNPFGPLTTKAAKAAHLSPEEAKPYSLLYTYSLIIALVCGTAGLPHILVRFYTNPNGVAAKRTTMWVMILIGIFYVFPPVFGVMGRNLFPELYAGIGAKGTDKIVLELPRLLNEHYAPLGSILSGITCAGAFAAFMSTFSGLLVSMTGALAHDVYGRMLRPKSTPEQRMRMFKFAAVLIGGIAVVMGSFVEPLEINFMVGQAFAIAAASYFPLLFMSVWWRGMTMRGAAIGMLTGGLCALVAATLTNMSNLALDKGPMGKIFAGFAPMNGFWSHHPLLRILCEQPAIWTVPLAITLMIVVSKLTRKEVPSDVRMKMLVLHAPEKLGLKQEYIQEHQHGH